MTGQDNGEKKTTAEAEAAPPKKPYASPRLRHLGSVRELTYGTGNLTSDGTGLPTGAQPL